MLPGYLALWLAFYSRALLLKIPRIQLRNASIVQGRGRLGCYPGCDKDSYMIIIVAGGPMCAPGL